MAAQACQEIVSLHQGTMKFESRSGEGTQVLISMKGGRECD